MHAEHILKDDSALYVQFVHLIADSIANRLAPSQISKCHQPANISNSILCSEEPHDIIDIEDIIAVGNEESYRVVDQPLSLRVEDEIACGRFARETEVPQTINIEANNNTSDTYRQDNAEIHLNHDHKEDKGEEEQHREIDQQQTNCNNDDDCANIIKIESKMNNNNISSTTQIAGTDVVSKVKVITVAGTFVAIEEIDTSKVIEIQYHIICTVYDFHL